MGSDLEEGPNHGFVSLPRRIMKWLKQISSSERDEQNKPVIFHQ